jgi:hypothetical protein
MVSLHSAYNRLDPDLFPTRGNRDGNTSRPPSLRSMMLAINVPFPEPEPKPPPMPPPPFPGRKPVREPDPSRLPDEEPLPNPDENDEPPQHAWGVTGLVSMIFVPLLVCAGCVPPVLA